MSSTEQEARLTDSQEQGHDGDFVQSLERGLSVIRAFDADHPKLTLSEVAAATGLSRAAARRFLRTLVQLGYMRSDGSRFALRPKILELGYAYLSSLTLPEVAMPHLEQLVEQVHESSSVSELDGDDVIYIARVPTKRIMTVTISVGTRFPAYATSMGRVMLAAQPDERLDEYLESTSLRGLTGHTITSATALRRELRKIRAQGWALVDQELEEGLRSIAAPIRDADGQVIAAINISTHAGRRTLNTIVEEFLQPLLTHRAPHRDGPGAFPRHGPGPARRLGPRGPASRRRAALPGLTSKERARREGSALGARRRRVRKQSRSEEGRRRQRTPGGEQANRAGRRRLTGARRRAGKAALPH